MSEDHAPELDAGQDQPSEDANARDFVFLIFRAVLRRDPAEVDAVAFTNAVTAGMPIRDFVTELMQTPEFNSTPPSMPTHSKSMDAERVVPADLTDLTSLSIDLLQARLADKGCACRLGPLPDGVAGQNVGPDSVERLLRTLAVLDAL